MAMKRMLFIVSEPSAVDNEGWKCGEVDMEALRRQIREQLREAVPVVVLPAGCGLWAIDLEREEPAEGEASPASP